MVSARERAGLVPEARACTAPTNDTIAINSANTSGREGGTRGEAAAPRGFRHGLAIGEVRGQPDRLLGLLSTGEL
jgi:hypothetical protein